MAKAYDKKIITPEQITIYNSLKRNKAEIKELEKELKEHYYVCHQIEGKYSIGTKTDPWAGQGCRGFYYEYKSSEDKQREIEEEEKYYNTYIKPLKEKISSLNKECSKLNETLCVALWGFGTEKYYLTQRKIGYEKKLKHYQELIAYIDEQLKNTP